jgi:hypothetical protein
VTGTGGERTSGKKRSDSAGATEHQGARRRASAKRFFSSLKAPRWRLGRASGHLCGVSAESRRIALRALAGPRQALVDASKRSR